MILAWQMNQITGSTARRLAALPYSLQHYPDRSQQCQHCQVIGSTARYPAVLPIMQDTLAWQTCQIASSPTRQKPAKPALSDKPEAPPDSCQHCQKTSSTARYQAEYQMESSSTESPNRCPTLVAQI